MFGVHIKSQNIDIFESNKLIKLTFLVVFF